MSFKLLDAIDQRGDIRQHVAHPEVEGRTICGIVPEMTQPNTDADPTMRDIHCGRCRRVIQARESLHSVVPRGQSPDEEGFKP